MIVLAGYGLSILLFVVILLWILVPALYGLPPVPTRPERIRNALKLAGLQPGETLYDLGAGDGRVLLIAAGEFGAKAVGIEIGPIQCVLAWLRVASRGAGKRVRIRWGNFYRADLSAADVVFVYATSKEVTRLAPHLKSEMKKGARLVSISADFSEWEPTAIDEHDLVFVYEMPPIEGSVTTYMLKRAE
ncbi:MAG: SAM-dependent methyltransferase [Bacteroidota bacterium]|jgi:precorrin-6B methylase 2